MVKGMKEEIFVAFLDMEKAYDRVNRKKLSPLFLNIYVRALGKVISNCVHGVKYAVVGKEGVMEWKSQAGLLYADDVCLKRT